MAELTVGFLGAGRMASALARGFISSGSLQSTHVIASDVLKQARDAFAETTQGAVTQSNQDVLEKSQIVILAVKPQVMPALLKEIAPLVRPDHLIVSIAAGVTLSTMESSLKDRRIIRVMPNTPCLVGAGASGFSRGQHCTQDDVEIVSRLLSTVGIALEVSESLLDAVTGLSGSGPAYVFEIIEALSDGGVLMGLHRTTATQLAAQTLIGAARMVLETGDHPGALKDAVTSPGGTTIAGLHALETGGLRGVLMDAVQAATLRSQELSQR